MTSRNNTSFSVSVYEQLKSSGQKWESKSGLLYHQYIIAEFMKSRLSQRGLLAFHEMGSGKTRLACAVIKAMRMAKNVIIAPASTKIQFESELHRMGLSSLNVKMVSLKSSTMAEQLELAVNSTSDELDPIKEFDASNLDNTFIVVDEVHNLCNSICNGSTNAIRFYDSVMEAKGVRLLFLSGSPIINDPYELAPCFNMLSGERIFNEAKDDFDKYFVKNGKIINENKFKNRILGLVSYYGDRVKPDHEDPHMAKALPMKIIRIPMSDTQYSTYSSMRESELKESKFPAKKGNSRFNAKMSASTYRIKSRLASNLSPSDATDTQLLKEATSPKFHRILKIIQGHKKQTGIIYSNFVHAGGLEDIARLLKLKGYEEYHSDTEDLPKFNKTVPKFAIVSGDITPKERDAIRQVFNGRDNTDGSKLQILLLGPAASEGFSLRNARWGIIVDPFFNYTRINQIKSRIRRYQSHSDLPPKERTVQFYILLADYPKNIPKKDRKELTTDFSLYIQAKKNYALSLQFYQAMVEASIDCNVFKDLLPAAKAKTLNCRMCLPTDKKLWNLRLDIDIPSPDPCVPPEKEKVKAKEIVIEDPDGTEYKYMYSLGPDREPVFYQYVESLGGYLDLPRNHRHYSELYDLVKK